MNLYKSIIASVFGALLLLLLLLLPLILFPAYALTQAPLAGLAPGGSTSLTLTAVDAGGNNVAWPNGQTATWASSNSGVTFSSTGPNTATIMVAPTLAAGTQVTIQATVAGASSAQQPFPVLAAASPAIATLIITQGSSAPPPSGTEAAPTTFIPGTYPGSSATGGFATDSPMVYLNLGDGSLPHFIQTQSGTSYWEFQPANWQTSTDWRIGLIYFDNTKAWYVNPNNTIGLFWVMGVWRDPSSGAQYAIIHTENADNSGDVNHMALSLATRAKGVQQWTILGHIIGPATYTTDANIGGSNPIYLTDNTSASPYLAALYNCPGGTCAARVSIAAMEAAGTGAPSPWFCWNGSAWAAPAIGTCTAVNDTSNLATGQNVGFIGASHSTVVYDADNKIFYVPADIDILSSPDLIHWTRVGQYLGVASLNGPDGKPVWETLQTETGARTMGPFYYSWVPDASHAATYNTNGAVGAWSAGNGPWVINAKIAGGSECCNGYVYTGIGLP